MPTLALVICRWALFAVLATLTACAWVPMSKNPNRIRSPERLAYEACMTQNGGTESLCQEERHALLMQQEWEMMSSDS